MKRVFLLCVLSLFGSISACKTATCPPCPTDTGNCALPTTPAAKIGSTTVTVAQLDAEASMQIYELRVQTLQGMIMKTVLEPMAQKEGLDLRSYLMKLAEPRVPKVSEAEARDFYDKNHDQFSPEISSQPFEALKDKLIEGLTMRKRQEFFPVIIEELKQKAGVEMILQPPRVKVAAEGPSKGPKDAKVTIVEFSDFQCPYCSKGRQVMDEVVKAYGDKVRVVFRDFPLNFHEQAQKAAEASHCAEEQGKFWQMHDWMFDHQTELAVDKLKDGAKSLGLDATKFNQCLDSGKYAKLVADNMKAGQIAGVKGTPAFFINGVFLNGAQPFESFKKEIDRELAR